MGEPDKPEGVILRIASDGHEQKGQAEYSIDAPIDKIGGSGEIRAENLTPQSQNFTIIVGVRF